VDAIDIRAADLYMNAIPDAGNATLRARPGQPATVVDVPSPAPATNAPDTSAAVGIVLPPSGTPDDPDAAPASAPPKSKTPPPPEDAVKTAPSEPTKPEPTTGSSEPGSAVDATKPKEEEVSPSQINWHTEIGKGRAGETANGSGT
jgi:hypothetical protein